MRLRLPIVLLFAPSIITVFVPGEAQTTNTPQINEQSAFSAEDEKVDSPVKVPDGVLEILRKDQRVLQYLEAERKSPTELTSEPFLASEIHLDGPKEIDLVIIGIGWFRGNGATFWVFRNLPDGYRLVLKATAHDLIAQRARSNGFRNISTGSPIAGSSIEIVYRFDGKKYEQYRTRSQPIR